ncbi:MAG: hypothetical protein M3160_00650 [Candidatus Eremiobacteraeota bacterium]|nr:hypothetical protein [Candidatus Eremiobacteraeota bacterium]
MIMRAFSLVCQIYALLAWGSAVADAAQTVYTLPKDIQWIPDKTKGVPPGSFYAYLRGKDGDRCGQLVRVKFTNGFVYPWHVNHDYSLYIVQKGKLVIGFDRRGLKSAERVLPAGSVMQGLQTEPHYGRAIGETIFDVYTVCTGK